jgi:hypothetical protein
MADPQTALVAALEAAGLSLESIAEEQRAMFTPLTDEEVNQLIRLHERHKARVAPDEPPWCR